MRATTSKIVKDSIRRFFYLGDMTIAKYILNTHGDLFKQDLEKIRSSVRYYRGKNGKEKLSHLANKEFVLPPSTKLSMPKSWNKKVHNYHLTSGLWLILSDVHVPFHEIKPLEAAIQAGQVEKVDGIFLNGDFQDCASVSYWPQRKRDFNAEVEQVVDMLDFLRQEFPKIPIVYKPGNHEYRLPRYYMSKAPELIDNPIASMETVLGLEERGIDFLDYFQKVMAGKLPILHGHEIRFISRQVNPARGLFLKAKTFAACSHCHTASEHNAKDLHDKLLTTWSFACLCDLHPDYNPFGNDWGWGFGLVNIEKNGDFEVINRRVLSSGKVV